MGNREHEDVSKHHDWRYRYFMKNLFQSLHGSPIVFPAALQSEGGKKMLSDDDFRRLLNTALTRDPECPWLYNA
jgi:hypothetical protein